MTDAAPVQLQTDQLQTVPGGGVRMLQATVTINGVATPVLMQVIASADAEGKILDAERDYNLQLAIIRELRAIRVLLATQMGEVVLDPEPVAPTQL